MKSYFIFKNRKKTLADILIFPESVLQHFCNGCFSAPISGKDMFSVASDEAHEMEINLKS
jgi:hypothetical protein